MARSRMCVSLVGIWSVILAGSSILAFAADQNTEGDAWLHMNSDTRTGFAWGYTVVLSRGFAEGCDKYRTIEGSKSRHLHDDPFARCLNSQNRGFSRPVDYYVTHVTEFYESFQSDRAVPFEEVLKKLSAHCWLRFEGFQ